jgi:hypothetical protein
MQQSNARFDGGEVLPRVLQSRRPGREVGRLLEKRVGLFEAALEDAELTRIVENREVVI